MVVFHVSDDIIIWFKTCYVGKLYTRSLPVDKKIKLVPDLMTKIIKNVSFIYKCNKTQKVQCHLCENISWPSSNETYMTLVGCINIRHYNNVLWIRATLSNLSTLASAQTLLVLVCFCLLVEYWANCCWPLVEQTGLT